METARTRPAACVRARFAFHGLIVALTSIACRDSTPADSVARPLASDAKPPADEPKPAEQPTQVAATSIPPAIPATPVVPEPPIQVDPPSTSPTTELRVDTLAYVAATNGPFPSMSDEASPRLVQHIELDFDHAQRDQLASELIDAGGFARLDATAATSVGLTPPREVWLFGSSEPCAAKLGSAYALAYDEGPRALELGYLLEPCTDDFAPIAQLDAPPPASWTPAAVTAKHTISSTADPAKWKHDKRAALETIGALAWAPNEDESRRPDVHVRVREAESIVELGFRWHWPAPDCSESEQGGGAIGSWTNRGFEPLPRLDPDDEFLDAELVGVLALAGQPLVIVSKADFQMYVAVDSGAGFTAWTPKLTGAYHDEVTATAGWSVLEHDCGP